MKDLKESAISVLTFKKCLHCSRWLKVSLGLISWISILQIAISTVVIIKG